MEDLNKEWRENELIPKDDVEEELWEWEDEVFTDASLLNVVDVRDVLDAGKN